MLVLGFDTELLLFTSLLLLSTVAARGICGDNIADWTDSIDDCDHPDGETRLVGVLRVWFCTTRPPRRLDNFRPIVATTGDA